MIFNKNSGCVRVWVTLIMSGVYTYEQVPKLFNLQEQVKLVLTEAGAMEDTTNRNNVQ